MANQEKTFPPQQQSPPGEQNQMHPRPKSEDKTQPPSGKLNSKAGVAPCYLFLPSDEPSTMPEQVLQRKRQKDQ
ncbi:MAG TPA: hypothetical protein VFX22_00580 [Candidatus Kapabacteria bacterium]|nr:hypothetical protein [Candidatus Kapabacteria bacterium]